MTTLRLSATVVLVAASIAAGGCSDHGRSKPAQAPAIGELKVGGRENRGEGFSPPFLPSPDGGVRRVFGRGYIGWIFDLSWTPTGDARESCGEPRIVQLLRDRVHVWRPELDPGVRAFMEQKYPDKRLFIDEPVSASDPTYAASVTAPDGRLHAFDTPGISVNAGKTLAMLAVHLETCVVCKPGWQPLICDRWGFVVDFNAQPPRIDADPVEQGAASAQFRDALGKFLRP